MKKSLIKLIKSARKPVLLAVLATLVVVCLHAAEWSDVQKQSEFVVTVSTPGIVDKEQEQQQICQEALDMSNLKADVDKAVRLAEVPAGIVPGIEYKRLLERRRLAETLYERALVRKTLSDRDEIASEENKERQLALSRAELRIEEARQALDSFMDVQSSSKSK